MFVRSCIIAVLLVGHVGCRTHHFLGRNVTRQTSTVTDLIQQQVLDNVACFAANPNTLPSFATISDGTTQTQDGGFTQPSATWNATTFTQFMLPMNASRQLMENWKLQPVMSAGRIRRLRCAFQMLFERPSLMLSQDGKSVCVPEGCINCVHDLITVGILPSPGAIANDPEMKDKPKDGCWTFKDKAIAELYLSKLQEAIDCRVPTGWFCIGPKPPKDVCMTGRCCDTYAWVAPGGSDGFARFTMTVMALATLDPPPSRQEMNVFLTLEKAKLRAALGQLAPLVGGLKTEGTQPFIHGMAMSQFAEASANADLSPNRLVEMYGNLSQLQARIDSSAAPGQERSVAEATATISQAQRAIQNLLTTPAVQTIDPFDRPGSMPLSRGGGIEFTPGLAGE